MAADRITYRDEGSVDYSECWKLQQSLFDSLVERKGLPGSGGNRAPEGAGAADGIGQTLILCEHPHVYTLGKSGKEGNMLMTPEFLESVGASLYRIDRGGDITYHGPGQLVGYPILDLDEMGLGLKEYIHLLEQSVIETIAEFGIDGGRSEGATGVWLEADGKGGLRKISAIGVRSSRFVTMHGFSLNVNPAMEYFSYINPCGFTDRGVTSMAAEIGHDPGLEEVKKVYAGKFKSVFGVKLV